MPRFPHKRKLIALGIGQRKMMYCQWVSSLWRSSRIHHRILSVSWKLNIRNV